MQKRIFASLAVAGLAGLAVLTGVGAHAVEVSQARPDMAWTLDDKGCKVANPFPKPDETVTWSGPCVDGWAEGEGTIQWFAKGQPGGRYVGAVVHGQQHGQGTYLVSRRSWYRGGFANGLRSGLGKSQSGDGSRYEGEFLNDWFQGQGVLTWADGRVYEGGFEAGLPHGDGVYIDLEGHRIDVRASKGLIWRRRAAAMEGAQAVQAAPPAPPVKGPPSLAMQRCAKFPPPQMPNMDWSGTATYVATASVIDGWVSSVAIQVVKHSGDPAVDSQIMAAIARAMRETYECKGDFIFQQEFAFRQN